ncbi:hypothetical protein ACSZNO_02430 [Aeromonas veronii]
MKNSHETGWALLLLGAALLLVQTLPARYWPDNAGLLAIFSHPVKGERPPRDWRGESGRITVQRPGWRFVQPDCSRKRRSLDIYCRLPVVKA